MSESAYKEALKQGQRAFRACVAKGEYPYLPVLDEILGDRSAGGERDLGTVQIPAEFIVGTRTAGRSRLFAGNFMPLAGEQSEFAAKWENLCRAHLNEGIREPIKAYEYMNRYYVEEGNKRVSVLKYYDAVTILGRVIRIQPAQCDTPEVRRYLELMDFYRVTGVNFIEFSRQGSCARMLELLGKQPQELWNDAERSAFTGAYYAFRSAFMAKGGDRLSVTVGDAMLAYLEIFGLDSLRGKSSAEVQKSVSKAWEEITLRQDQEPIDVKLDPEEKKPGLISRVLSVGDSRILRAAFIHDGNPRVSGWTQSHERGREYVQQTLAGQIETKAYFDAMDQDPLSVMEEAITAGNTTLFTTSPRLLPAALKAAVEHPEVTVFNCALNTPHRYIRTYYARMYEVKFVVGAIAGALAGDESVGYICDYPIYGQIAGINAFALGVQMVNPGTKVYLEWSSVGGSDEAIKRLTDRGIRLISSQDLVRQGDEWRSTGLTLRQDGREVRMATPLWQWGTYYERLLRQIRDRSEQTEYKESGKALNYYWGLSAGVVDLRCTDNVPPATQKLAWLLMDSIRTGICDPFRGPIFTQNGYAPREDWTMAQIIGIDELVENVIGEIPNYDAISDIAKSTVDQVGVVKATKEGARADHA